MDKGNALQNGGETGMTKGYLEALRCKAEELEWSWYEDGSGYIQLRKCSPAGEDFSVTANVGSLVDEIRDIRDCFDIEDHVRELLDAKADGFEGVPDVKTLIEDADAIQEMLNELSDALEEVEDDG